MVQYDQDIIVSSILIKTQSEWDNLPNMLREEERKTITREKLKVHRRFLREKVGLLN